MALEWTARWDFGWKRKNVHIIDNGKPENVEILIDGKPTDLKPSYKDTNNALVKDITNRGTLLTIVENIDKLYVSNNVKEYIAYLLLLWDSHQD